MAPNQSPPPNRRQKKARSAAGKDSINESEGDKHSVHQLPRYVE